MGLFGLFGKGGKKTEQTPAGQELEPYAGMQVEITDTDGQVLFVAKLLGVQRNSAQLSQSTEAQLDQAQEGDPLEVQIRGYSDSQAAAIHIKGAITPRPDRVWLAENLEVVKKGNDRAFFRIDTNLSAGATPMDQGEEDSCRLLNISVGGARIGSGRDYQVGDKFLLRAQLLPDREPTVILCQVLRVIPREQGRTEYGCRFLELKEADEDKITQIIFDMQRKKRSSY